jgi:hypothetical protein
VRKTLSLAVLALWLASAGVPAWAQATADQLNKLSLEALTAPPSRPAGGYAPAPRRASPYRGHYRAAPHSWQAPRYRAARPSFARPYRYSRPRSYSRPRGHAVPYVRAPGVHRVSPHGPSLHPRGYNRR